jgi:serine/threonine protein kinase
MTTPTGWERLKAIFVEALDREDSEREQFLLEACKGDTELYNEALKLLASHEHAAHFLSNGAVNLAVSGEPNPMFEPGQLVAERFRIVRFIARGGMGEVYEAEDAVLNERVALKTVQPRIADAKTFELFKQEIQSARRVTHPNVCRIHDVAEHGEPPVMLLTMELLDGPTLSRRLRESGPFSRREALPLIEQMVAALQAAHDAGVIHRDFKPGNVILTGQPSAWRPVITDFGLAQSSGSGRATVRAGTPGYMAPEQREGASATPAVDVYALGVVIAQMIGAVLPADDPETDAEPNNLGPWRRVVEGCLRKDPAARYQRPADVARALRSRQARSRRAFAACLASLLLVPGVLYFRTAQRRPDASALLIRKIADEPAEVNFLRPSPDGRWISATIGDFRDLALRNIETGEVRVLTRMEQRKGNAGSAVFSPDGATIAYQSITRVEGQFQSEVRLIGFDGSNDRLLYFDPQVAVYPCDWSPDGTRLLVQLWRGYLAQIGQLSVTTGALTLITDTEKRSLEQARYSPDGSEVVFTIGGARREEGIFAVSLDVGSERLLMKGVPHQYLAGVSADGRLVIVSDRTGSFGLWTLPIAGGPAAPELVVPDVGPIDPVGLTREGALCYKSFINFRNVYTARLDLRAKRTVGAPEPVTAQFVGNQHFPSWSPSGEELALLAQKNRLDPILLFISLRVVGTPVRELPLDFGLGRPQWRGNKLIGFSSSRGKGEYHTVDPLTGETTPLIDAGKLGTTYEGAWSADGQVWYNRFSKWERGLFRFDFRSQTQQVIFVPGPGMEMGLENLALSPDGETLAFQIREQNYTRSTLMLLSTRGGEPRRLWTIEKPHNFLYGAFTWLPDSRRLLVARSRENVSELWLVPADGSPPERIDFPEVPVRNLRLNPDGQTIAYHAGEEQYELRMIENFLPTR